MFDSFSLPPLSPFFLFVCLAWFTDSHAKHAIVRKVHLSSSPSLTHTHNKQELSAQATTFLNSNVFCGFGSVILPISIWGYLSV